MKNLIKNIDKSKALTLKDEVEYRDGQVVSKTLTQNDYVSITLFSFDKGEGFPRTSPAATRSSPASTAWAKSPSTARITRSQRGSR